MENITAMSFGEEIYGVYRMGMLKNLDAKEVRKYPSWKNLTDKEQKVWEETSLAARKGIPFTSPRNLRPDPKLEEIIDRSNEFALLTSNEWDVYSRLSQAYNQYADLPVLFKGDEIDFVFHINALKSLLMSRPVEREMLKRNWPGYGDTYDTTE